ncbi:MAG: bifunctional UDP-N-acetylglucosamine diphosphorylase/glucosamine-1-phosphate N-acetyltransferase GlmU [Candidatus Eremiobacteraeota bacterium]|nr:bifunctional UDP-N-acetylglucosamine diphosphorylase/glucosamine-1-phosphate N-acetyltransferase GlmU [Candidatus Eremiobacteraeota bacterium]
MKELAVIILAAGKSKRMKTRTPKVLHLLAGKPVIDYVLDAVKPMGASQTYMVVGYGMEQVTEHIGKEVTFVHQEPLLGTGHAVQQVMPHLKDFKGNVLVLCGDMPLISNEILANFLASHLEDGAPLSLLTARVPWETDFGRIVRDDKEAIEKIVEYRDATPYERSLNEVNLSIYLFDADHLRKVLPRIGLPNVQKELYLTDTVYLTRTEGLAVHGHLCPDPEASRGINSRIDLQAIYQVMRRRTMERLMLEGVTIIDPLSCHIDSTVKIGTDTVIYPYTILEGNTVIGEECHIGPSTRVSGATIASRVTIMHSIVMESTIDEETQVGPFAYIRPDNVIGKKVKIGDFVELKKSVIGKGTKVPHLSYVGDATLGEGVNIGAGTITCNYDGVRKNPTFIEDGAHIGSNTNLVAPVRVGKHAVTGAGAVVTKDVPDYGLAVGIPAVIKKIIDH